jgi:hypothetical protein
VTARKDTQAKTAYVVRTDAVVVDGEHHHYGATVKLSAADAKPLLALGKVEKP